MSKKTHEEYVEEVKIKNPNIEVIEKYINAKTKILHRCKIHNFEWKVTPGSILQGCGCQQCKIDKDNINSKKKQKTHEQYVEELINKNIAIEPLERYVGCDANIKHKCKICGYEWNPRPSSILYGCGCPKCGIKKVQESKTKAHDKYIMELSINNPDLEVLEQYVGSLVPIKHICKKHNVIWNIRPSDALKGKGCRQCQKEKISNKTVKKHRQYQSELIEKNINIEVIEAYKNAVTPILHRCLKCDYEWLVAPNNILRGSGCPKCKESHGEKLISNWLKNHNIEFISQYRFEDCKDKHTLPFDFYLPKNNICIEYQGEQHYREIGYFGGYDGFQTRKLHDQIKKNYCQNNDILLLQIRYDENVEEKLSSFIH